MPYYLKKDLPGIKAGTEMMRSTNSMWSPKDRQRWLNIPGEELSDWIEERPDVTISREAADGIKAWIRRERETYGPDVCAHCVRLTDKIESMVEKK